MSVKYLSRKNLFLVSEMGRVPPTPSRIHSIINFLHSTVHCYPGDPPCRENGPTERPLLTSYVVFEPLCFNVCLLHLTSDPHHPFTPHPLPQPPLHAPATRNTLLSLLFFIALLFQSVTPPHYNSLFSLFFLVFLNFYIKPSVK